MGTSPFAVPSLERLHGLGFPVLAAYSQPPRPAGRGHKLQKSALHEAAERLGIEVRTPRTLRDPEVQAEFAALGADLAVVGAYGLLLPRPILDAPRLGCVNLHGSLLPRWRGAAPIQRAILAGDAESGISVFRMEEGLDTGPVYATRPVPIGPRTTAAGAARPAGGARGRDDPGNRRRLAPGTLRAEPQPEEGVTYAHKLRREEGRIDFAEPADVIERRLRALNLWPGCHTEVAGERLMLLEGEVEASAPAGAGPGTVVGLPLTVACGEGALRVTRVQRAGRKAMGADEMQRGFAGAAGEQVGGYASLGIDPLDRRCRRDRCPTWHELLDRRKIDATFA
jgi:methionyl-tRNA formyltransferase